MKFTDVDGDYKLRPLKKDYTVANLIADLKVNTFLIDIIINNEYIDTPLTKVIENKVSVRLKYKSNVIIHLASDNKKLALCMDFDVRTTDKLITVELYYTVLDKYVTIVCFDKISVLSILQKLKIDDDKIILVNRAEWIPNTLAKDGDKITVASDLEQALYYSNTF